VAIRRGSRSGRWLAGGSVPFLLIGLMAAAGHASGASTGSTTMTTTTFPHGENYSWANSGLSGGGFISVIASAPSSDCSTPNGTTPSGTTLIAGGDTEGFFRSCDDGATWTPENMTTDKNVLPPEARHVAAILPAGNGTWYAAVGDGTNGGFAISADDGQTWQYWPSVSGSQSCPIGSSTTCSPPIFDGSNLPGQNGHPRATGNLLAESTNGVYLFAATFNSGLERWKISDNGGTGWQQVALPGAQLRSLAVDPTTSAQVFVADHEPDSPGTGTDVIYQVSGIGGQTEATTDISDSSMIGSSAAGTPGTQELLDISGRLYAAGGTGLYEWCPSCSPTWTQLDPASQNNNWYTLNGYNVSGSNDIIYAAAIHGSSVNSTTRYRNVEEFSVTNETPPAGPPTVTVTNLTDPASVNDDVYGAGAPWWVSNADPTSMIDGSSYIGSNIAFEPTSSGNPNVYVAGKSGVWRLDGASDMWQPAVNGLATTFDLTVAVDPNNPQNVAATDADWYFLDSQDSFDTVAQDSYAAVQSAGSGSGTSGLDLVWDTSTSPSSAIYSSGDQGSTDDSNDGGVIWRNTAPLTGGTWSTIANPTSSDRPIALATQRSGGSYILFAAFEGSGVWQYTPGTPWVQLSGTNLSGTNLGGPTFSASDIKGASFAWPSSSSSSGPIYVYDESSGLWRYTLGTHGTPSWAHMSTKADGTGWVIADPAGDTVWLSTSGTGLQEFTGACGSSCTPSFTLNLPNGGGPLAASPDGNIYMAVPAGPETAGAVSVSPPMLLMSNSSTNYSKWYDISGAYYQSTAAQPQSMAVNPNTDQLYVATAGNGVIIGTAPSG
jgi:hypothetical protein